jgi:ribonuclease HI
MREIIIFADGSSMGNPGPGGWGAVVILGNNVMELGGGEKYTTNNRMELTASIQALSSVKGKRGKIVFYTDSRYVIYGVTKWIHGWEKSCWIGANRKEVLNKDLWVKLGRLVKDKNIEWKHVRGHVGIAGNERADFLATMCAREQKWKKEKFFMGPLSKYPFDVLNTKADAGKSAAREKMKSRKNNSGVKAHSYLSLVGGKLMRHKTWGECEKRVKGVSGAKFKKAVSAEDEKDIMKSWGVK